MTHDDVQKAAEAAQDYIVTHKFTHVGVEMERVAREVAFGGFLQGATWQAAKDRAEIEELKAKLASQASSHGMYITQTIEPKIEELEAERERLVAALKMKHGLCANGSCTRCAVLAKALGEA